MPSMRRKLLSKRESSRVDESLSSRLLELSIMQNMITKIRRSERQSSLEHSHIPYVRSLRMRDEKERSSSIRSSQMLMITMDMTHRLMSTKTWQKPESSIRKKSLEARWKTRSQSLECFSRPRRSSQMFQRKKKLPQCQIQAWVAWECTSHRRIGILKKLRISFFVFSSFCL